MAKAATHYEQVPVKFVIKLADIDMESRKDAKRAPETGDKDERRTARTRKSDGKA